MQTVLLVVHLVVVAVLIGLVIVQRSEGGGLGMGGGGNSAFSSTRVQANALSRMTMVFGVLFFAGSLGLAIMSNYVNRKPSLLNAPAAQTGPQAPVSGSGSQGLLPLLRGNNETPQAPVSPAAPQKPADPQAPAQPQAPVPGAQQQSAPPGPPVQ
jgi:preprotein translocase subunit SecG